MTRNTENEAIRIGAHLSHNIIQDRMKSYKESLPTEKKNEIWNIVTDFKLMKLKIFLNSGKIIFSTDAEDIGKINTKSYFHNAVAKGNIYTKLVKKNTLSLDGQAVTSDVVETYIPIMENHQFLGAFEIYYDITERKENLDKLLSFSTLFLIILGLGFQISIIIALTNAGRHIEQHHTSEKALQVSESRYRSFFEDDLSGAFISSPDGNLIACNPAFAKILGFETVEEMKDFNMNLIYPDSSPRVDFMNLLRKEGRVEQYESILCRKGSAPIHTVENTIGVFDEQGNLIEIRGYLIDVTPQKKLEKQLQQSQKMESIGTLAGGIAHDFNNILFHIIGYAEMALEDIADDHAAKSSLKEILKATHRARELIRRILTFSRHSDHDKKPMKLQPILEETLKMIRSTFPTTIEIQKSIEKDCGVIKADSTQIYQIIMNLCTNAYHAMRKKGGVLGVRLEKIDGASAIYECAELQNESYLKLTISDTGHGIDKEIMDRIFDPYFTTRKKEQGTGMGLSVVHGIVKNHNGHITADSELGKGSNFRVYIPLIPGDTEDADEMPKVEIPEGSEHILIVDDEELIVKMLTKILKRLGYRVTGRTSSIECMEAFRTNPGRFDLVISDMTMPGLTGDRLAVKLLEIRNDIPIIICTGFSDLINMEKARKIGIHALIMKPIVTKELAEIIRQVLDFKVLEKEASVEIAPPKILLVDDDPNNREVFAFFMKNIPFELDTAGSGQIGLEKFKSGSYDIVFMDIEMPEMDGRMASEKIREWETENQLQPTRIIALTGHDEATMHSISEYGIDDYLLKPFEFEELLAVLNHSIPGYSKYVAGVEIKEAPSIPEHAGAHENSSGKLPGINIEAALKRLRGNKKLLSNIIKQFAEDYTDMTDIIRRDLSLDDKASALRKTHTLKGVAGNISAEEVYALAIKLEQCMRDGGSDMENLLAQLDDALEEVFRASSRL